MTIEQLNNKVTELENKIQLLEARLNSLTNNNVLRNNVLRTPTQLIVSPTQGVLRTPTQVIVSPTQNVLRTPGPILVSPKNGIIYRGPSVVERSTVVPGYLYKRKPGFNLNLYGV